MKNLWAQEVLFPLKINKAYHPLILFNNFTIQQLLSQKHLGIHLVGQLTFKQYFNEKINKENKGIGIICKLNNIRLHSALLTIYRSFVRPHIGYGDVIYDQFFDYFKNSVIHVLRERNNQNFRKLLLSFIKPTCSTPFSIHHHVGVKLLVDWELVLAICVNINLGKIFIILWILYVLAVSSLKQLYTIFFRF